MSDYTFYDFTGRSRYAMGDSNYFTLSYRRTMSSVSLPKHLSKVIASKGLPYLRIREDNLTKALHFVFTKDTGAKMRLTKENMIVNNREMARFLIKKLGLPDTYLTRRIELSEDLSNSDDYATFLIKKPVTEDGNITDNP